MPSRPVIRTVNFITLLALCPAAIAQVERPPAGTLVYAGGPFPISIAKTAVDTAGNTYVIGGWIPEVPLNGPQVYSLHDVFVSKIDLSGSIVWLTYLGGRGDNIAKGIAVDASGSVYGVGSTTSPDFPLQHAIQSSMSTGFTTGFIFKLDGAGSIVWSTYFGGSGLALIGSSVNAVAVDAAGNAYVTGTSDAANFPTTPGAFQMNGNFSSNAVSPAASAFVAKISAAGTILYSTWFGGTKPNCSGGSQCQGYQRQDNGTAIAVDSAGNAYVAGYSDSVDFPVTPGAFQANCACSNNDFQFTPFVAKLKPDGSGLIYSTYLGSHNASDPLIVIDSSGNAYLAGSTTSAQFPTTAGVLQTTLSGGTDVYVSAFNPAGTTLRFSTYLGGSGDDIPTGLALYGDGTILLSGTTSSPNFPGFFGQFPAGPSFLAVLSPGATQVLISTRFPAGAGDRDVKLDPLTHAVIAAGSSGYVMRLYTPSGPFPPIFGVGNAANGTVDNALAPGELVSIYGIGIGPSPAVTAQPDSGKYPDSLAGFQVLFNDTPAPLSYASDTQINAVDSASLSNSPVVTVKVVNNGMTLAQITLPQAATRPGIFRNGDYAAAVNQDGTINSEHNPAKSGSIVSIWATGGASGFDNGGGYVTTSANVVNYYDPNGFFQVLAPAIGVGYVPYEFYPVTYAGPAPGLIGAVFQINLQVSTPPLPPLMPGDALATVSLLAGGVVSPPALIYVAP